MNKPYAESTLRRKYRETGIPRDLIDTAIAYLHACAEFYYAVEIDDIIAILQRQGNISPETLNTLLPIFARDDALSFYIENEKELYQDGKDKLWLISKDYLCVENPDCTDDDLRRFATDESYDGPAPLMEEWERFYELNKQRAGKKQFVPKNILLYAQEDYFESTQQATAMLRFLRGKVDDPELVLLMMLDIIKDVTVPMTKTIQVVMEKTDYKPSGMAEMGEFTRLFTDLSNNTRLPSNRGFTPNELSKPGLPKSISFGPGIQEALRSGKINGDDLKRTVGEQEWPEDLKSSILSEVDRALAPGEERWVGGTLIKGAKIRPKATPHKAAPSSIARQDMI